MGESGFSGSSSGHYDCRMPVDSTFRRFPRSPQSPTTRRLRISGVFRGLALVAFLAGGAGRSDPQTVAGVVVVLGLVLAGFATWWAVLAAPLVGGLAGLPAAFGYHPYALVALALASLVCAAGFARVVLP